MDEEMKTNLELVGVIIVIVLAVGGFGWYDYEYPNNGARTWLIIGCVALVFYLVGEIIYLKRKKPIINKKWRTMKYGDFLCDNFILMIGGLIGSFVVIGFSYFGYLMYQMSDVWISGLIEAGYFIGSVVAFLGLKLWLYYWFVARKKE